VQASLFSPLWHRVSGLRPRLRGGVRVQRQRYRGETWYLLADEASGRQHRINAAAYEFIGRFDGRASVNELWSLLLERFGETAPDQDEIVRTLQRLAEAELVQLEGTDIAGLFRRSAERARRRRPLVNPLAFSMPLFDPSALLARIEPYALRLFHPAAALAGAALVLAAAFAAAMNWDVLRAHAASHLASGYYLALVWASYPVVKLLHELAHALAVRRWGGEVHEFGITFLVFTPAPYRDAAAAGAFRSRWRRAAVSLAGIGVELAIGAAALLLWLAVERGVVSDVAFVLLVVCLASSLLFNANPLLRFDGYHALCDLIDAPNLALRSHAYWLHLARRVLGGDASTAPARGPGELKWLLAYAPLSWGYRLALSAGLALWVGEKSALLGWLAAAALLFFVVLRPAYGTARTLWHSFPAGRPQRRAAWAMALTGLLSAGALLALPVPSTVTVQGIVWPADQARVRAEAEGFVVEVLAHDGDSVEPGTPLVVLAEPALLAERDMLRARLLGLRARQYDAILREPAQARNVIEDLERTRAELERAEQRIAQWTVRSKASGRLVLARGQDLPGSFVPKGTTLGYVLEAAPPLVRVSVPEEHAALLRGRTRQVEVRLADERAARSARLAREIPASTRVLPSAALGAPAGGPHAVDPTDKEGTRTLDPLFLIDVALERTALQRLGERAWVRFHLGFEPLAMQWERRVRQALLKHFNPSS
jgi:putative peptide zinc metalloprotease protein